MFIYVMCATGGRYNVRTREVLSNKNLEDWSTEEAEETAVSIACVYYLYVCVAHAAFFSHIMHYNSLYKRLPWLLTLSRLT